MMDSQVQKQAENPIRIQPLLLTVKETNKANVTKENQDILKNLPHEFEGLGSVKSKQLEHIHGQITRIKETKHISLSLARLLPFALIFASNSEHTSSHFIVNSKDTHH